MSFYRTNRNAPKTNKVTIYLQGHDVDCEFSLAVRGSELEITLIDAKNSNTGKDPQLSDDYLIGAIKQEVRAHNLAVFNYKELT